VIIKITQNNYGKMAHLKCDKCGKEFKRAFGQTNKHNHYCSRICAGKGRPDTDLHNCIICNKLKDNSFYDKSSTRPLCSKACYSVWFDNYYAACNKWERKGMPNNMGNDVSKSNNVFYKQGRLLYSNLQGVY